MMLHSQSLKYTDTEVIESYQYFLKRLLILKEEQLVKKWNNFKKEKSLDGIIFSSAWLGLDRNTCAVLEVPSINNIKYEISITNVWGEEVWNFSDKGDGILSSIKLGFCLPNNKSILSSDVVRVELASKKTKLHFYSSLASKDALDGLRLYTTSKVFLNKSPKVNVSNEKLPGIEIFNSVFEVFLSDSAQGVGNELRLATLLKVATYAREPSEQKPINLIIEKFAIPKVKGLRERASVYLGR